MPIRPSGLARAIECPASVWQPDQGMTIDPNRYQEACDRGTEIHAWWESLLTPNPLPPPCPPKYQDIWIAEAERMDPGGEAEVHFLLWEYQGQPLVTRGVRPPPDAVGGSDEVSWDGDAPDLPDPPRSGATFVMRGTADRLGRGADGKHPWVEDLKTGSRKVSPKSWQLQAYGLMWWVDLGRPGDGVTTSVLTFFRNLRKPGTASRKHAHLSVGTLFTAWRTFLKLRDRVAAKEPPTPNDECSLCPVASSCPALARVPF